MTLLDLVPENLTRARDEISKAGVQSHVKAVAEGTIVDLSRFADGRFDAVLCLGAPVCHVYPDSERCRAVSELVRVAKKGAPIFISVISKYGVLLSTPEGWPQAVTTEQFTSVVETGDDYHFGGSGYCHFFTLNEFESMFDGQGVDILCRVGLEGFNTSLKTTNDFAANYPEACVNGSKSTNPFARIRLSWTPRPYADRRPEKVTNPIVIPELFLLMK